MKAVATTKIPAIVKHCALAIYDDLKGSQAQRFANALKYAVSRLSEYGFLTEGSKDQEADKLSLTTKGHEREREHAREPKTKNDRFDKMYQAFMKNRENKKVSKTPLPSKAGK